MGKKVGLTLQDVVDVAAAIADRDGLEAMTLRAVADQLGVKTPSLYNHVAGLSGLRRELALHAASQLAAVVDGAATQADPAEVIRRTARDYRRFALEHPGLYQALLPAPRPGADDELYNAMAAPVATLAETLVAGGVDETQTLHTIRTLRAVVHGFIDLETKDGFGMPEDIEVSFERALEVVIDGVMVSR